MRSSFQVRIYILQGSESSSAELDRPADLLALRMASINQLLDPWVYILLRKENMLRVLTLMERFRRHKGVRYTKTYICVRVNEMRN